MIAVFVHYDLLLNNCVTCNNSCKKKITMAKRVIVLCLDRTLEMEDKIVVPYTTSTTFSDLLVRAKERVRKVPSEDLQELRLRSERGGYLHPEDLLVELPAVACNAIELALVPLVRWIAHERLEPFGHQRQRRRAEEHIATAKRRAGSSVSSVRVEWDRIFHDGLALAC